MAAADPAANAKMVTIANKGPARRFVRHNARIKSAARTDAEGAAEHAIQGRHATRRGNALRPAWQSAQGKAAVRTVVEGNAACAAKVRSAETMANASLPGPVSTPQTPRFSVNTQTLSSQI